MKKVNFLSVMLPVLVLAGSLNAQDSKTIDNMSRYSSKNEKKGWTHSGIANLTFGQSSLDNWIAGGDSWSITNNALLNFKFDYLKNEWFWDNMLEAEYGMINAETTGNRKASDKLNINSVGGYKISNKWAAAALCNFKTQFAKGYDYANRKSTDNYISKLFAPAYLDFAFGFTYKPAPNYSIFLSPLAERTTFVLDDSLSNAYAYGVKQGKKVMFETGSYIMGRAEQTLTKDLTLISSLYLFTPYNKYFGNIDTNFNLLLNWKLNKFLSASLNTTLRYYDREIQRLQVKEIFGLGLTYTF
ncbi:MAG: DUF3078 domain-containing protein [Dysgonamonadaceae bacterium]|jgi:hypothetical protein|nr:DUF3078 domain-containing protein [Dysgonamonadaceae bacterium]